MKLHPKKLIYSLSVLAVALGLGISTPVFARNSSSISSDGSSSHSDSQVSDSSTPQSTDPSPPASTATKTEDDQKGHDLAEKLKEQAHEQLQVKREQVKTHTQEDRQKACEQRKGNMSNRMDGLTSKAEKHKTTFDGIYTKAKAFHDSKQLNVSNYDALTAKVDAAQADAAAKIAVLKALDVPADCTQTTIADNVSAFRQALSNTRDSLKTYRTALKNLLTALHDANAAANSSTSTN